MYDHVLRLERRTKLLATGGMIARLVVHLVYWITLFAVIIVGIEFFPNQDFVEAVLFPYGASSDQTSRIAIRFAYFIVYPVLWTFICVPFFAAAEFLIHAADHAASSAYQLRLLHRMNRPANGDKSLEAPVPTSQSNDYVWQPTGEVIPGGNKHGRWVMVPTEKRRWFWMND